MSRQNQRKSSNVKLPFALRKELGLPDQRDGVGKRRQNGGSVADRKELRKSIRDGKKRGGSSSQGRSSVMDALSEDESQSVKVKPVVREVGTKEPKQKIIRSTTKTESTERPKSILKKPVARSMLSTDSTSSERSRSSSPGLVLDPNSRSFRQHAEEDDADIAALERKLGLKGKKSKLGDDMLDFVLDGLEEEPESKKRKREGQDWLEQKRRRVVDRSAEEVHSSSEGDDDNELDEFDSEDMLEGSDEDSILDLEDDEDGTDNAFGTDASDNSEDDQEGSEEDEFDGFDATADSDERPVVRVRENPYIAPVAPGSTSGKYIPPSLRKREDSSTSDLTMLRRQLQGQLNKLSEANMVSILGEVEKVYRTNARQDVTTVLIDLILSSFCIQSALQNTFIILHAAFLAAVYKVMGTDFGAELVVQTIERFDQEHQNAEQGKESLNLISLLANLFTFNVVSSNIIYDHIRLLLSDFSEVNAELLLRVVRDCGPQLRSDDPSALKEIVQTLQDISANMSKKGQTINIRTRVMMDTITDLKNNKMKNATNAAGLTGEHITRMRKAIGSLNNRTLKATEPLRITRNDIANSDKKGKWWLVGASWKGNEQKESSNHVPLDGRIIDTPYPEAEEEVDLLALAKQFQMNTDVRRSIFIAIMSAEDCRDAQTRLIKLRLSTKQEQEVAKVLLRCARAEPTYNPYYAFLAKNLCKENKKVRMGFQFGLWDFFRRMGENADDEESDNEGDSSAVELHEIVNIAKMYAYLIFHGHMAIGILKTLNIGFLKQQATMFLEVLLIAIMTQPKADEDALMKVFGRAADTPQVVKGLQYFVRKSVRHSDLITKKDKEKVKEGCRIAETAFKIIGSTEVD